MIKRFKKWYAWFATMVAETTIELKAIFNGEVERKACINCGRVRLYITEHVKPELNHKVLLFCNKKCKNTYLENEQAAGRYDGKYLYEDNVTPVYQFENGDYAEVAPLPDFEGSEINDFIWVSILTKHEVGTLENRKFVNDVLNNDMN